MFIKDGELYLTPLQADGLRKFESLPRVVVEKIIAGSDAWVTQTLAADLPEPAEDRFPGEQRLLRKVMAHAKWMRNANQEPPISVVLDKEELLTLKGAAAAAINAAQEKVSSLDGDPVLQEAGMYLIVEKGMDASLVEGKLQDTVAIGLFDTIDLAHLAISAIDQYFSAAS